MFFEKLIYFLSFECLGSESTFDSKAYRASFMRRKKIKMNRR